MDESALILPSKNIDPVKWDNCITGNTITLIYAKYHYLNRLCDNWSGLVIGDYEAVLPLPWRKKLGIRYYYAPAFIQQLGLFGKQDLIAPESLLQLITGYAKYGDLFWNNANKWLLSTLAVKTKTNFIINLNKSYTNILSAYSKDLVHNLNKADKFNLEYNLSNDISTAIRLYREQYGDRFPHIRSKDYQQFQQLCFEFAQNEQCFTRTVLDAVTKEILAICLLLKDDKRLYLIINAGTPKGRSHSANHFLIDQLLQEFSEENLVFDFEGSDIEGVSSFYENFHPENQPYFHYRHNQLYFIGKLLINWKQKKY